ncbi:MAG: MFS transporter [Deltaproteobacteria bacterium]|nr:MFS transporter [Deltaproteobacteria bacterium]
MFANLHRDVVILMASRGVRAFAFSYLSVVFTIYLAQLGYSTVTIGLVVSTAYASGAVLTALWGFLSDRYGRKNILMLLAALTIVSNTIYVFFSHLFFILSATNAFVGSSMGALGALLSGLPQYLQETWSWQPIASYKPLFLLTILFGVVLIFAYGSIEEHHVPRRRQAQKTSAAPVSGFVVKMSLLGMVDNLGGGLISPLISYWFFLRYGVELKSLGFMFFLSYLLAALSFLVAPLLARRLGVVPTMAFSHGAASLIYLFLPLAPTFSMAAAMTILRSFLAYMDNPLRSSFIMGVVRPEDRGSAAGITSLSRHVPVAVSPSLSAYMMQSFSLNVPIFLGGFLQLFHDCVFYFMFRNVKPPEEQSSKT